MVHPAVLLVSWGGLAFALQWASATSALTVAAISLVASLRFARRRTLNLLRRSRWLLISLAVLFLFFTPGEYLHGIAGSIGLTREGLQNATMHLGRLVALLTSLALLHERIGTQGLLSGLYGLMGGIGIRERTVVRLMLVLDQVERQDRSDWRSWLAPAAVEGDEGDVLSLRTPPMRVLDRWLIGSMLLAILATGLMS